MRRRALPETWLIVGSTSIIARAFASLVAEEKHALILAARNTAENERTAADLRVRFGSSVETVAFDAAVPGDSLLSHCRAAQGVLNAVIAVGDLRDQTALEVVPSMRREVLEANFVGPASLMIDLAQLMRERGGGRLVVLSSVAADRGRASNYIYGSAKAGLAVLAEGLAGRSFRDNVTVTTVKLGYVDTRMTFSLGKGVARLAISPRQAAKAIYLATRRRRVVAYVPWFWRWIMIIVRAVPAPVFKRMSI